MINYKKIINNLTNLFQISLLTTKDIKQEIRNLIQFKKEKNINQLNNSLSSDLEEIKNKINNITLKKYSKFYNINKSKILEYPINIETYLNSISRIIKKNNFKGNLLLY